MNGLNVKGKDRTVLREAEEEFKRRGNFKLIFPADSYGYYKSFFEEERPLNSLLDRYFREKGIGLIQK